MKHYPVLHDDKFIWKSLKTGNKDAFARLYDRYVRILYSYGKKITKDERLIEDSIQDLFIDLWQSREKLGEIETARFYLFRSLRRRIYKSAVRTSSRFGFPEPAPEIPEPASESHEASMIVNEEAARTTQILDNLIRNLPARQGEALLLYFYENFGYREIGELLSINEQSARNLVHRALEKLRKYAASSQSPLSFLLIAYLVHLDQLKPYH